MKVKEITAKVVIEEIKWARRKNSGILILDDETMLDGVELALEKQIPRDIEKKVVGWKIDCFCPSCTLEVFNWQSYCFVCGQALNWD